MASPKQESLSYQGSTKVIFTHTQNTHTHKEREISLSQEDSLSAGTGTEALSKTTNQWCPVPLVPNEAEGTVANGRSMQDGVRQRVGIHVQECTCIHRYSPTKADKQVFIHIHTGADGQIFPRIFFHLSLFIHSTTSLGRRKVRLPPNLKSCCLLLFPSVLGFKDLFTDIHPRSLLPPGFTSYSTAGGFAVPGEEAAGRNR